MKNKISEIENLIAAKHEKSLVKKALSGDKAAFAQIVADNKNRIEAVGYKFFHNLSDTEDFIQEVYVKVYKNLANFQGKSRLSTWITRIAFTTALNIKDSRKDYVNFDEGSEDTLPSKYDTPENQQIKEITRKTINDAVKDLPQNYGICIKMFFYLDMSQEDISEATGIPVNTVKSNIFRAKKMLSERLRGLL